MAAVVVGVWLGRSQPTGFETATTGTEIAASTGSLQADALIPVDLGQTWEDIDNPAADGWPTEAFHELAKEQLKKIAHFIEKREPAEIDGVAADSFSSARLVPSQLDLVFQDSMLRVERGVASVEAAEQATDPTAGDVPLRRALQEFAEVLPRSDGARCEFKIVSVRKSGDVVTTRQYVSCSSSGSEQALEVHAQWQAQWLLPAGTNEAASRPGGNSAEPARLPRLFHLQSMDFERVTKVHAARSLFADCTASAIGGNRCYAEQFLQGLNHWLERIQDNRYFPLLGAAGIAVGDVDGDGRDDLYVCQEGELPNRLFLGQADGTAHEMSQSAGVDWLAATRSALLVDLDNDGDQDLVAGLIGAVVLAANDGRGTFDVRQVLAVADDVMSLSASDYDRDGDLDIYVCVNYANDWLGPASAQSMAATSPSFVYHDANNGGPNSLFRNDENWRFANVTEEVGLDSNNRRYSLAAAWEDFDNDGDSDLYVANDYGRNNLFRNDLTPEGGVRFTDVAAEMGAEDSASGMSVAWADVNHDGWQDLYVSNMFSSAGQRVTEQQEFKPGTATDVRTRLQRFARGNTLLLNQADRAFQDVSESAGVTLGRWAWGSNFVDVNNDGWDDLVVANGYITTADPGDL